MDVAPEGAEMPFSFTGVTKSELPDTPTADFAAGSSDGSNEQA